MSCSFMTCITSPKSMYFIAMSSCYVTDKDFLGVDLLRGFNTPFFYLIINDPLRIQSLAFNFLGVVHLLRSLFRGEIL